MIDVSKYDFIDFGCSIGGSSFFARKLGGNSGIGFDIDKKKIYKARQNGVKAICADVTKLVLPKKCVKFCILSHFLEHLDNMEQAEKCIALAIKSSKDFVFIQGPYFDADKRLKQLGLKLFWADWGGHRVKITSDFLRRILGQRKCSYSLFGYIPIMSSLDVNVHSLASPRNSFEYNPNKHPSKPTALFNFPVYKEIVCIIWLSNRVKREIVIRSKKKGLVQLCT